MTADNPHSVNPSPNADYETFCREVADWNSTHPTGWVPEELVQKAATLLALGNVGQRWATTPAPDWPGFLVICDYEETRPHQLNSGHVGSDKPDGLVCHNPRPMKVSPIDGSER